MDIRSLTSLLNPVLEPLGYELDAVEVVPAGRRSIVRITVDGDGASGRGLSLDEIAEATRAVSDALDASPVTGSAAYTLEVSSRGVSRPLQSARHWRRNVDRLVAVTLASGEHFAGRIRGIEDEVAVIEVNQQSRRVPLADVTKAVVQVEFTKAGAAALEAARDWDGADEDTDDEAAHDEDEEV